MPEKPDANGALYNIDVSRAPLRLSGIINNLEYCICWWVSGNIKLTATQSERR